MESYLEVISASGSEGTEDNEDIINDLNEVIEEETGTGTKEEKDSTTSKSPEPVSSERENKFERIPVSEYEIYRSFDKLVGEKTAIYISHRMSSCRFCSQILVFNHGKIVQQGSHEELLKDEDGLYHEMWDAQAQYYI